MPMDRCGFSPGSSQGPGPPPSLPWLTFGLGEAAHNGFGQMWVGHLARVGHTLNPVLSSHRQSGYDSESLVEVRPVNRSDFILKILILPGPLYVHTILAG